MSEGQITNQPIGSQFTNQPPGRRIRRAPARPVGWAIALAFLVFRWRCSAAAIYYFQTFVSKTDYAIASMARKRPTSQSLSSQRDG